MHSNIIEIEDNLFYNPLPTEFDTRPAEVRTFIPSLYPALTRELNRYSANLKNKDTHRLLENYIDIDFFEFPFVTVLKQNNNIVGFSTGYTRNFYPNNCVRILNRYYQDSNNLRVKFTREVLRPTTYNILTHQLEMCKRLNFDQCFISREPRTNNFFQKFIDKVEDSTNYIWEFSSGPFLVAPNPRNNECWQSIAMTKFKDIESVNFWNHWRTK
jgi:hypothetical protein